MRADDVLRRFYGVIPAGGVGTRLWPLSRAAAPKFLHDLTGSGSTLIRATMRDWRRSVMDERWSSQAALIAAR